MLREQTVATMSRSLVYCEAQSVMFRGFSIIPKEILYMIDAHLSDAGRTSLALTCKSLFYSLFPSGVLPELDNKHLNQILLSYESSLEQQYLCFRCARLRRFDPNSEEEWKGSVQPREGWIAPLRHGCYPGKSKKLQHTIFQKLHADLDFSFLRAWMCPWSKSDIIWEPRSSGPAVGFSVAHLIMNRHLHGKLHGISTSALEGSYVYDKFIFVNGGIVTPDFKLSDPTKSDERRNLSIDGLLSTSEPASSSIQSESYSDTILPEYFLGQPDSSSSSVDSDLTPRLPRPPRPPGALARWRFTHDYKVKIIDDELFIARFHTIRGPGLPCDEQFLQLLDKFNLPVCAHLCCLRPTESRYSIVGEMRDPCGKTPYVSEAIGSCVGCFSDYEIKIRQGDMDQELRVDLMTYHRLGSCRTPQDFCWQLLRKTNTGCRPELGEFRKGEVRQKWHEDDGRHVEGEAQWSPRCCDTKATNIGRHCHHFHHPTGDRGQADAVRALRYWLNMREIPNQSDIEVRGLLVRPGSDASTWAG